MVKKFEYLNYDKIMMLMEIFMILQGQLTKYKKISYFEIFLFALTLPFTARSLIILYDKNI